MDFNFQFPERAENSSQRQTQPVNTQDNGHHQQHVQPVSQRQTQPIDIHGNGYQRQYKQPHYQTQVHLMGMHGDSYTHQHAQPSRQRHADHVPVYSNTQVPRALQAAGQHGSNPVPRHNDYHVPRLPQSTSKAEGAPITVHANQQTTRTPRPTIQTQFETSTMPRAATQQSGPFPVLPRHGVPSPAQQASPVAQGAKDVYPLGYYQPHTSQAQVEPLRHAASQPNVRQATASNREPQHVAPSASKARPGTPYAFHYPSRGVGKQVQGSSRSSGGDQEGSRMSTDDGYTSWLAGQGGSPSTPAEYYDVQTNPFDQEEVSPVLPRDYTPTSPSPLRQEWRLSRTRSASTLARGTMTTGVAIPSEHTRTRAATAATARPPPPGPSRVESQYQQSADASLSAGNPGHSGDQVVRDLPEFIAPPMATRQRWVHAGGNAKLEDREEIPDFNLPKAIRTGSPPEPPSWVPAPHPNAHFVDTSVTPVTVTAAGRAASMRSSQAMLGTMTTGTSDPTAGWAGSPSLSSPPVNGTPIADEFTSSSSLRSEVSATSLARTEAAAQPTGANLPSEDHGSTVRPPRDGRRDTWDLFAENGWSAPRSEQVEQPPVDEEVIVDHTADPIGPQTSTDDTGGKRPRKPSSSTSLTFSQRIKRVFFRKPSISDGFTGGRRRRDRDETDFG